MTATKQTKLLPCPFCQREAQQTLSSGLVSCAHDECPAFLLAVTAEHWNTRAQSTPEPVQGEDVKVVGYLTTASKLGHAHEHGAFNYLAVDAIAQEDHWRERGCAVSTDELMTVAQHNRIMAAAKNAAQPEVAENTGSTATNLTPTGGGAGSPPVEAAATAYEAGEGVDIFAWATFDGEGGFDLRLFENNERYMDDWLETNGARYARWVFPLYTAAAKPDAELVELLSRYRRDLSLKTFPLGDDCEYNIKWTTSEISRIDAKLAELQSCSHVE